MTENFEFPEDAESALSVDVAVTADGSAEMVLKGRLDALEASPLGRRLDALVESGTRWLLIDLAQVRFVDSAGLAVLIRARRRTRSAGGDVVLVRPAADDAMRVFHLTQFDQVFRMLTAREENWKE